MGGLLTAQGGKTQDLSLGLLDPWAPFKVADQHGLRRTSDTASRPTANAAIGRCFGATSHTSLVAVCNACSERHAFQIDKKSEHRKQNAEHDYRGSYLKITDSRGADRDLFARCPIGWL